MTEHEIQRGTIAILRSMGYVVWSTSTNRPSRCTRGTPDAFVAVGEGLAVCLEFKRPKGAKASKEQIAQDDMGLVYTVRSVEDAIAAVRECRGLRGVVRK